MKTKPDQFRLLLAIATLGCLAFFVSIPAKADNSLYGTYDFDGKATVKATAGDLPFGLGSLSLNETLDASGSIKLMSDKLIVQLDEPISRREVIRLNRKLRSPNRDRYRYRTSGTTKFRGNDVLYRVSLRLKRKDGKWGGRGRVFTKATSGDLSGSSVKVRGTIEQR